MTKETFIKALNGERNRKYKDVLIDLIENAETLENRSGKIEMFVRLCYSDQGKAIALANFDNYENCNTLATHDLSSFFCSNLSELITKLRIQ